MEISTSLKGLKFIHCLFSNPNSYQTVPIDHSDIRISKVIVIVLYLESYKTVLY